MNECAVFSPLYPTEQDLEVISDQLARGIFINNETGVRVCGWRPINE